MQPGQDDPYNQQQPPTPPGSYPPPASGPTSPDAYPTPSGSYPSLPPPGMPPPAMPPQMGDGAPSNTLGLVSMILGIASIPLVCCFYIGMALGIAAIITGFLGKRKAERGHATNRGQAVTGLITGAVALVFGIALIITVVAWGYKLPTGTSS